LQLQYTSLNAPARPFPWSFAFQAPLPAFQTIEAVICWLMIAVEFYGSNRQNHLTGRRTIFKLNLSFSKY
jgi:hypothetical protein